MVTQCKQERREALLIVDTVRFNPPMALTTCTCSCTASAKRPAL
jgi:hypothetical protein